MIPLFLDRVNLRVIAMKRYFTLFQSPELEPQLKDSEKVGRYMRKRFGAVGARERERERHDDKGEPNQKVNDRFPKFQVMNLADVQVRKPVGD